MIIDFHTHVFPDKIAASTVSALSINTGIPAYAPGTADGLLSALRDAGVAVGVNLPPLTKPTQFESVKKFAEELNRREYTDARIVSFAGAHPDMDDVEGKMRSLREAGFVGIKIHPDYQGTFIDDERYVRIFLSAKREGLYVLTHSGVDGAYLGQPVKCTPTGVLRLLDKIGGYDRIILAHLGANEMFSEVYNSLAGEDVYFDTAYCLGRAGDMFVRILERHGEDKILFGSDSPWQSVKEQVDIIRGYSLGKEVEEKIFSKNAIKILGL